MATIVLQAVGTAVGSVVGGPFGAVVGRALGGLVGAQVDQSLFGAGDKTITGPRLDSVQALSSREGAPIAKVFGRTKVAGEIIWATRFEEVQSTQTQSQGVKGGKPKTSVESFQYFANFAVGLCEGEIACIRRIWADGKLIKNIDHTLRVYRGTASQLPDSLIEAKQGSGNAPAYRGLAYVVFEQFALADFGNRIPQIAIEVIRPIGELEKNVRAVNMIPGATEFGYDTEPVIEKISSVESRNLNVHQTVAESDFLASLDELLAICPNLEQIALVVAWFGDDLRAGNCSVQPCAETSFRDITDGESWKVAGLERNAVKLVSTINGSPAYGGTPSDKSVLRAIAAIKARGIRVCINPFLMMDVPAGNTLPSPYGGASQDVYPWRGRITCHPARGETGSVDGSTAAASQVSSFVGTEQLSDISVSNGSVDHGNLSAWSYRRFILHYIRLAELAGGVDMFMVGSEFRGLSRIRDGLGNFPFVDALADLADDAKSVLGTSCIVTYGADWTEYFGFQPNDGSGDVFYNLDKLWAKASIDAVGIDNYMPLSDWRADGDPAGLGRDGYDPDMLIDQMAKGEGFDWYYTSDQNRADGVRTAITDGSNKPWVYRYKDLKSWWSNSHYDRRAGVEVSASSAWVPYSKPLIFTELGCPAIHNGPAQPNVFYDPKSSESAFPYFSNGGRDDQAQAAYIIAQQRYWDPASADFKNAHNPISPVYGDRMLDHSLSQLWAWDARPFPAFPSYDDVWSDGENWHTGHWLNGRLGGVRLSDLLAELLDASGVESIDVTQVYGTFDGYTIAETTSVRAALEVLISLYQLSVFEDGGVMTFRSPGQDESSLITTELVVFKKGEAQTSFRSEQESELPSLTALFHVDPTTDFQDAETKVQRINGGRQRHENLVAPLVCSSSLMEPVLQEWLQDRWTARDTVSFGLPKANLDLTVGDEFVLDSATNAQRWRIVSIEEGEGLQISARAVESAIVKGARPSDAPWETAQPAAQFPPYLKFLDLPYLAQSDADDANRVVVASVPWQGPVTLYSSPSTSGYTYVQSLNNSGFVGSLLGALAGTSVTSRWNRADQIIVNLQNGSLSSAENSLVFNGTNALAVQSGTGAWEIIQFADAELIDVQTWRLTNVLRGQAGTEAEAAVGCPDGADVVILNQAVVPLENGGKNRGLELNWQAGSSGGVLGDSSFARMTYTPGYRGLQPFSPVHIKTVMTQSDSLSVSWVRRDRVGGDDWSVVEIANNESAEAYRIEIVDSVGAMLSTSASQTQCMFSNADMVSSFGTGPKDLTARVSQVSASTGPGSPGTINFSVTL